MNKKILLLLIIIFINYLPGIAQQADSLNKKKYDLQELISIAKNKSISALRAATIKENRYWQWRTFQSNYKPQLSLQGVLPDFNRRVRAVEQNDGTTEYVHVFNSNSSLTLELSQAIGATGGEIFISSDIQRFDEFEEDVTIYSGDPAFIGVNQPIFAFNPLSWDRKIQPLRFEESKKQFVEDLEEIAVNTTQLFFDLLLAQVSLEIAQKNLANNDTIYKISEGRYKLGTIAENELLQLELQVLKSRQDVAQAQVDLETSSLRLRSYAGITNTQSIALELPSFIPEFVVNEEMAINEARKNRQEAIGFERQRLEAERELAQAKGENGLNVNVFATFGLTNSANDIPDIYVNPEDQQSVRLGFEIPIVDWGRSKSLIKTADANKKLVEYTVAQDEINFNEEILTHVKRFKVLREQVKITTLADDIAQRRYNITKNRYMIGKVDITNLNIALTEKDEAKRAFIASLRSFWVAYYDLRRLTLYDFENQEVLIEEEL